LLGRSRPSPTRPTRSNSLLIFILLIASTIVVIGSTGPFAGVRSTLSDFLRPVKNAGATIGAPIANLFDSIGSHQDLIDENRRLRDENADLASRAGLADDALRQRRELFELNKIVDTTGLPSVAAQVVSGSSSNFRDVTIEIDAGTNKGVREGMPVVAGLGLVGRVTVVTAKTSRVRLFTDGSMGVGVRLANSGEVGTIRGAGANQDMKIGLIDPSTEVTVGELVLTSGLGSSRFPNNLALGRVKSAKVVPGELEQDVVMQPFIDLKRVGLVRVLLWVPAPPVPLLPVTTQVTTTTTTLPLPTAVPPTTANDGGGG
jgi:rod shape-determining protein MreC